MIQIVFASRILELNAAKEKLEIVKSRGEAAPNSRGVPRRLRRRNAFELIREYCTHKNKAVNRLVFVGVVISDIIIEYDVRLR